MTLEELKALLESGLKELKKHQKDQTEEYKCLDENLKKLNKQQDLSDSGMADLKNKHQIQTEKVAKIDKTLQDIVEKMSQYNKTAQSTMLSLGQLAAKGLKDQSIDVETAQQGVLCKANISLFNKNITSADGSAGALTEPDRRGLIRTPEQPLTIRDLLTTVTTSYGSIEWIRELLYDNQASPQAGEGAPKGRSNITFQKENTPVQTLPHWFGISRQVLSDARGLMSIINNRGVYGLKLKEDLQLLMGDGTGNNLSGLQPNATTFDASLSQPGDTKIDQLRRAIYQAGLSFLPTTGIVLNPKDWMDLELTKTDDNAYLFANPFNATQPRLWGRAVAESYHETIGQFLLGAFSTAATLYDREAVTVRFSESHANFFVENMVALLIEERLALTVEYPNALVTGTLQATPVIR